MNNKTSSGGVKRHITRGSKRKKKRIRRIKRRLISCPNEVGGEEHDIFGGEALTFGKRWFR